MDTITLTLIFLACFSTVNCNIWDNIVSNSYAPYLHVPSNFVLVLTDNSTFFKPELGLTVSGDNNTVMLEFNTTVGGNTDPIPIAKAIYNITKNELNMSLRGECRTFPIEYQIGIKNVSNTIVIGQLATFYDKASSMAGAYHVFDMANLLSSLKVKGYKARLYYTKEEFPVLTKLDFSSPDGNRTLYVKNYQIIGHFEEGHFQFKEECKIASKEMQDQFWKIVQIIIQILFG